MGKKRKLPATHGRRLQSQQSQQQQPPLKRQNMQKKQAAVHHSLNSKSATSPAARNNAACTSTADPTIPFDSEKDAILLVGEGDLSFAAALVDHHGCVDVTATVLEDSPAALAAKYPQAAANAARIEAGGGTVLYATDVRAMGPWVRRDKHASGGSGNGNGNGKVGRMDRILFNFPHVGGKSTDVNRQVRHNQELLVSFFRRALLSLAPGGSIVVTLFEREPYTLWNVRDLARHAGLQVERSFRFQFSAYPGYHHARTLGVVRRRRRKDQKQKAKQRESGEDDEDEDGEDGEKDYDGTKDRDSSKNDANRNGNAKDGSGIKHRDADGDTEGDHEDENEDEELATGAWRGEDRAARSYVFVRKDEMPKQKPRKKRKPGESSSDDDDDDDE